MDCASQAAAEQYGSTTVGEYTHEQKERQMVPFFKNDLEILQYALTLEHLENEAYKVINASGKLSDRNAAYLRIIGKHEQDHVDALTAAITKAGAVPVKARKTYNFGALGDLTTEVGLLKVAQKMEELGVGAYNGAGIEIMDKNILGVAGQIVQVEARHTGLLRALNNVQPSPDAPSSPISDKSPAEAFPPALTPEMVLMAVKDVLGEEQQ